MRACTTDLGVIAAKTSIPGAPFGMAKPKVVEGLEQNVAASVPLLAV